LHHSGNQEGIPVVHAGITRGPGSIRDAVPADLPAGRGRSLPACEAASSI